MKNSRKNPAFRPGDLVTATGGTHKVIGRQYSREFGWRYHLSNINRGTFHRNVPEADLDQVGHTDDD